jgi:hypothetical protein
MIVRIPKTFVARVTDQRGGRCQQIERPVLADVYKAVKAGNFKIVFLFREFHNGDVEVI